MVFIFKTNKMTKSFIQIFVAFCPNNQGMWIFDKNNKWSLIRAYWSMAWELGNNNNKNENAKLLFFQTENKFSRVNIENLISQLNCVKILIIVLWATSDLSRSSDYSGKESYRMHAKKTCSWFHVACNKTKNHTQLHRDRKNWSKQMFWFYHHVSRSR